ncbi:hypothetical protein [Halorubrum sp. LN27]|uniref:hypothetical protein n=1 Tax=Halorubrum sp. LN27 TaxID=2801032 RepID=UPI00190DD0C9|nr:hypothetical protein [Halorubrum sp. LN27]
MHRRDLVFGVGAASVGGSALLGTGAFSRVESQRDVTVQVAEDPDAYLGLSATGSLNSENYVAIDGDGHLAIDVSDHDDFDGPDAEPGEGVNSDSTTWFDAMFEVCNQGKADAAFHVREFDDDAFPPGAASDAPLDFYHYPDGDGAPGEESSLVGEDAAVTIPLGECLTVGVRTETHGVDATGGTTLFDEEIVAVADATVTDESPPTDSGAISLAPNADPETELESQFDALGAVDALDDGASATNAVEVCVEKAGADGETPIAVQVTDHHGEFDESPTTWNPGSDSLASATIEFDSGTGCFAIGNPGVDGVLFTLFPFGGGLASVADIDNVAVAVAGEEPDAMTVEGVQVSAPTTLGTASAGDEPFDEYEADR